MNAKALHERMLDVIRGADASPFEREVIASVANEVFMGSAEMLDAYYADSPIFLLCDEKTDLPNFMTTAGDWDLKGFQLYYSETDYDETDDTMPAGVSLVTIEEAISKFSNSSAPTI